jgi:hypothetical protein
MSDSTSPIFSDVEAALNTYSCNLDWDTSADKARLALNAIRYLLINRPLTSALSGVNISFSDLQNEKTAIESYLSSQNRLSWTVGRTYR